MLYGRLMHAVCRALVHTVAALVGMGLLATGYGFGVVWLATRSLPGRAQWLLIAPLATAVALLSAAIVVQQALAPVIAAQRLLRFVGRMPAMLAAQPQISNRDLARQLDCSEEEAAEVRHVLDRLMQAVRPLAQLIA
jgi:hypothetical protein